MILQTVHVNKLFLNLWSNLFYGRSLWVFSNNIIFDASLWDLYISHDAHNHQGWGFHKGYSLQDLLPVHLRSWSVNFPDDVDHTNLVPEKSCEVTRLGRVILREALYCSTVLLAALPQQEAQGPMPGSWEIPVRHLTTARRPADRATLNY